MIFLYILLCIVLLINILLLIPLVITVNYDKKDFFISIKYLFFSLYPRKEKDVITVKTNEHDKTDNKNEMNKQVLEQELEKEKQEYQNIIDKIKGDVKKDTGGIPESENLDSEDSIKEDEETSEPKINSFKDVKEKWNKVKKYFPISKKYIKKLIKKIKIKDVVLNIKVADKDAYQCAMNFGKMNILVYNTLGAVTKLFDVTLKSIKVDCDFNKDCNEYSFSGKVQLKPGAMLVIGMRVLVEYIVVCLKEKKKIKKNAKTLIKGDV